MGRLTPQIWVRFPQVTNMLQVYVFLRLRTEWHTNAPLYLFFKWWVGQVGKASLSQGEDHEFEPRTHYTGNLQQTFQDLKIGF